LPAFLQGCIDSFCAKKSSFQDEKFLPCPYLTLFSIRSA
jgi:hypothetical protein